MPVATPAEFAKLLDDCRLIDPARRAELDGLRTRCADSKTLAQELLRRGWITPYQANQLLAGQGGGLTMGPYLLLERLGEGGTGQVFKARHQAMKRIVALKVIRKDLTGDPEVVQRFYREIQVISQLSHPNIIHAFDAGPIGPVHVLVMEYLEGMDLARLLKQSGPLPAAVACDYIRQAAMGLQHAHERGLIHRDIKPSNLFVTQGQGQRSTGFATVKVLDLGLARFQRAAEGGDLTGVLTPAGPITMGTPDYLAPEQAIDFHHVDIRADIYGLGCTLMFLLTGEPPFPGGSLAQKLMRHQQAEPPKVHERRPDLPRTLDPIIRRMLAKRREDRPASPAAVAEALAPLAGRAAPLSTAISPKDSTETPLGTEVGPLDATVREPMVPSLAPAKARRRRLLPAIGGAMLLVGIAAVFLIRPAREKPQAVAPTEAAKPLPAVVRLKLDRVQGEVAIRSDAGKSPAQNGQALSTGQWVQTGGAASGVRLAWPDGTSLDLGPNTTVGEPTGAGKQVAVQSFGLIHASVPKQAEGQPVVITSPQAEVRTSFGRFTLAGIGETAWLRVDEGTVRLTRSAGGQTLDVVAGGYACITPGALPSVKPLGQAVRVLDDFEQPALNNWWPWNGAGDPAKATTTRELVSPGKIGKKALRAEYKLPQYCPGGLNYDIPPGPGRDWSGYHCLRFWLHGGNTGQNIALSIKSNGSLDYVIRDNFSGWREFVLPFSSFSREKEFADKGVPFDFRSVFRVIVLLCPDRLCQGSFQLDQFELLEHEILK